MTSLNVAQVLQNGVAAYSQGRLQEAEQIYRSILQSQPQTLSNPQDRNILAQTYSYLGLTLRDMGDLKSYVDCFKQAALIKPHDPDVFNNLGAAQQFNGELDAAIHSYQYAVKLDPSCAEAYNNMGNALQDKGNLEAAIQAFKLALQLKPDYENAYNNLGNALHHKGELDKAIACYRNAVQISPNSPQARNNLGNALRDAARYEEAIKHFDFISATKVPPSSAQFWFNSRSQALECLYILGRYSELMERLYVLAESGEINLREAAVSAFVSHQLKVEDPYPFCKKPLDFFHQGNLGSYIADVNRFAEDLIAEASQVSQVWEPQHGVTRAGFQTSPIVLQTGEHTDALEKILRQEIAAYFDKFKSQKCAYMDMWPDDYFLRGWFVRLVKQGYQQPHNHPSGWLSGVIYLKTVEPQTADEGAIELGLHGHDLPILDDSYARIVHQPKVGDIILFPSSLFHRTIPFSQDTERCVIAFDLYRYSH